MGPSRSLACYLALLLLAATAYVYADKHAASIASMGVEEIEEQLQECAIVQDLNEYKAAITPHTSSLTSRIFAVLFPSAHPGINALLATLYISGPPNFLLALCPPNIDPSSLSIMVAFAVGGLLGDTFLHLLPEIFNGEEEHDKVKFVLVEPNRNLLLGVAVIVGFLTFVAMDKSLRIATGGEGHTHDHGIGSSQTAEPVGTTSALEDSPAKSTRARRKGNNAGGHDELVEEEKSQSKETNASVKLAGYLNLMSVSLVGD